MREQVKSRQRVTDHGEVLTGFVQRWLRWLRRAERHRDLRLIRRPVRELRYLAAGACRRPLP